MAEIVDPLDDLNELEARLRAEFAIKIVAKEEELQRIYDAETLVAKKSHDEEMAILKTEKSALESKLQDGTIENGDENAILRDKTEINSRIQQLEEERKQREQDLKKAGNEAYLELFKD